MTYDEVKAATAEILNFEHNRLEKHVDKVRANYIEAANREVADELSQMKLIDYEFQRRSMMRG